MSTILYVDHIDDNYGHPIGRVINLDKINRILKQIDADMSMITDLMSQTNNVQYVQRAGKFLINTRLMLDAPQYKSQMVIADVKDDETLANSFAASLEPPLMQLAMKLFHELHYLTEEEKAKFEMAVGD